MRYFVFVLVVSSLAANHSSEQSKLSPAEQEVLDARNARTEASNNRNPAAWSRYVADECIFSTDSGARASKAEVSRVVAKLPHDYEYSVDPRDGCACLWERRGVESALYDTREI